MDVRLCVCGLDWAAIGAVGQWAAAFGTVFSLYYLRKQSRDNQRHFETQLADNRKHFQEQMDVGAQQFQEQMSVTTKQFQEQLTEDRQRAISARHDALIPYLTVSVALMSPYRERIELRLNCFNGGLGVARAVQAEYHSGLHGEIQRFWDVMDISVGERVVAELNDIPRPARGWIVLHYEDVLGKPLDQKFMVEELDGVIRLFALKTDGSKGPLIFKS